MQMFGVFFQYEVAPLVLQEQIMQENHPRLFSIVTPLFLRSSSVTTPSFVHRLSIAAPSLLHLNDGVSMDYRWITDGLSSEDERQYKGALAYNNSYQKQTGKRKKRKIMQK